MNNTIDHVATECRLWFAILRTSGLKAFVRRGLRFAANFVFMYQKFYVYRIKTDVSPIASMPEGIEFKLLEKTEDYTALVKAGYILDPFVVSGDYRLKHGARCLCFFQQKTLRDIGWFSTDQPSKDSLTDIPCRVAFDRGEAYLGKVERNKKFTRPVYAAVTMHRRALDMLRQMGFSEGLFIVLQNNLVHQFGLAKRADARPGAEARYLKILWWRWWWEKPLDAQPEHLARVQMVRDAYTVIHDC